MATPPMWNPKWHDAHGPVLAEIAAERLHQITGEAERHGTAARLPQVAIYFNETELRQIIAALSF